MSQNQSNAIFRVSHEKGEAAKKISFNAIPRAILPSYENLTQPVVFGILEVLSKSEDPIDGSRLVGRVLEIVPETNFETIYKTALSLASPNEQRYPLINARSNVINEMNPWENKFSLSEAGKFFKPIDLKTPAILPHSLVNGLFLQKCKIPPHRIEDFLAGVEKCVNDPEASANGIFSELVGPDYPTGGIVATEANSYVGKASGKIYSKGIASYEEEKDGTTIKITALPYGLSVQKFISLISDYAKKEKNIISIKDLSGESLCVVINCTKRIDAPRFISLLEEEKILSTQIRCSSFFFDSDKNVLKSPNYAALIKHYAQSRIDYHMENNGKSLSDAKLQVIADIKESLKKLSSERRTSRVSLREGGEDIPELPMIITMTAAGMIKRTSAGAWKNQGRGGKGISGTALLSNEKESLEHVVFALTTDFIGIGMEDGTITIAPVHKIPEMKKDDLGTPMKMVFNVEEADIPSCICRIRDSESASLVMASENGKVGRTEISAALKMRGGRKLLFKVKDTKMSHMGMAYDEDNIVLVATNGFSLNVPSARIGTRKGACSPVKGIELAEGGKLVSLVCPVDGDELFIVKTSGKGKRLKLEDLPASHLGAKGMQVAGIMGEKEKIAGALNVSEKDDIMIATSSGNTIRLAASNVPIFGKDSEGSKLITINEESMEIVKTAAKLDNFEQPSSSSGEENLPESTAASESTEDANPSEADVSAETEPTEQDNPTEENPEETGEKEENDSEESNTNENDI